MYYGDEKALQMGRSILPSTGRKGARYFRRAAHQRARTHERAELRRLLLDDEDECVFDMDIERYRARDIRSMVRNRRDKDKVSSLIHWAEAKTAEMPRDERLSFVRAFLPDNLIGWHAAQHLRFNDHFRSTADLDLLERKHPPTYKALPQLDRETLLEEILPAGLARINAAITANHRPVQWKQWNSEIVILKPPSKNLTERWRRDSAFPCARGDWETVTVGPEARTLRGISDISAFLHDLEAASKGPGIERNPRQVARRTLLNPQGQEIGTHTIGLTPPYRRSMDYHPEWLEALDAFLRAWLDAGRDVFKVPTPHLAKSIPWWLGSY